MEVVHSGLGMNNPKGTNSDVHCCSSAQTYDYIELFTACRRRRTKVNFIPNVSKRGNLGRS